jgi:ubiquinone/menaquinone biosynthesis C-methylase UbiE
MTRTDRFDRWSATYDRASLRPLYERAHDGVLQLAAEWRLRPRRALDVGCGTGRLLAAFADRHEEAALVGIDVSSGMLATARANAHYDRIVFCQAAVEQLPFADRTFDLVTSTVSFRHWNDQHAGVREIARVLDSGAPVLLAGLFGAARPSRLRPQGGLPSALCRASARSPTSLCSRQSAARRAALPGPRCPHRT